LDFSRVRKIIALDNKSPVTIKQYETTLIHAGAY
jgi:hypothetical protein